MAKKKTKKKAKKKTAKKTTPKIRYRYRTKYVPLPEHLSCIELHRAKLEIKRAVPIMPCTLINKDHKGRLFAHTQAEEIYKVFREQCNNKGLVIRRIKGKSKLATYPRFKFIDDKLEVVEEPCVRYNGVWEICHVESGGRETFHGSGDGTNDVWSINSAQTVAKKCGLLDYFEVPWPQPTDFAELVSDRLNNLEPGALEKALNQIIPPKIMQATSIGEVLTNYFNEVLKRQKGK